ncbi:hypothetical protein [Methanospirillum sp.]|jgi:predicted nucleotidyltransferase|uniref:nucleotidyltransferase family protein n=1 Tax=Methanospirillum sp. TaxID=45200 RepID=UPI001BD2D095|nr:hypothetical protein [Methanospirillum sp.]
MLLRQSKSLRQSILKKIFDGRIVPQDPNDESAFVFLVDMNEDASLLDLARLKNDLENLLGTPIDITTRSALHPMLSDAILKEAIAL